LYRRIQGYFRYSASKCPVSLCFIGVSPKLPYVLYHPNLQVDSKRREGYKDVFKPVLRSGGCPQSLSEFSGVTYHLSCFYLLFCKGRSLPSDGIILSGVFSI